MVTLVMSDDTDDEVIMEVFTKHLELWLVCRACAINHEKKKKSREKEKCLW